MRWFFFLFVFFSLNNDVVIFDKQKSSAKWYTTNDDVMGGVSTSSLRRLADGSALFSGTVSTANNGGFAMVRLPLNIKLSEENSKIILTVKGDGKKYQFRIKSKRYQRYWYVQTFQTSNTLQEIELPLDDFYPAFRGYRLNSDNFSADQLKEIAILIGNKKDESFSLEIEKMIIR